MKPFLSILVCFTFAMAEAAPSASLFFKGRGSNYTVSYNDTRDIRVDSDNDGFIDAWMISNSTYEIVILFEKNTPSKITIKRFEAHKVTAVEYKIEKGNYIAKDFTSRPLAVFNGEICDDNSNGEKFKSLTRPVMMAAAGNAISCASRDNMQNILTMALTEIILETKKGSGVVACLKDPELSKNFKRKDIKQILSLQAENLNLDIQKIALADPGMKDLISCETSPKISKIKGQFIENGKITFKLPDGLKDTPSAADVKKLVYHELLHKAGIQKDDNVDGILSSCSSGAPLSGSMQDGFTPTLGPPTAAAVEDASNKNSQASADTKDSALKATSKQSRNVASTAAEKGGGGEGVNIAKEVSVAEVKAAVPSADKLAVNSVNMTDEGKAQAVASSQAQSAPVFAMADRAMGVMNTPALASDDSSSSSSSSYTASSSTSGSSSSSTRSASSDRYQSRYNGYESTAGKSRSASSDRHLSKGVYLAGNKNMRVVEEVDLTKGDSASSGTTRTTNAASGNSRMVASTGRTVPATGTGSDEVGNGSAAAGGGSVGSSAGGGGTYFANGAANSNTRKTNAATRSGGSAAGSNGGSREDVLSNFTGTSYSVAKDMIKESSFQQKMVEYQITVIDSAGSRWGASKGKTVFSDDGTRFIRVK